MIISTTGSVSRQQGLPGQGGGPLAAAWLPRLVATSAHATLCVRAFNTQGPMRIHARMRVNARAPYTPTDASMYLLLCFSGALDLVGAHVELPQGSEQVRGGWAVHSCGGCVCVVCVCVCVCVCACGGCMQKHACFTRGRVREDAHVHVHVHLHSRAAVSAHVLCMCVGSKRAPVAFATGARSVLGSCALLEPEAAPLLSLLSATLPTGIHPFHPPLRSPCTAPAPLALPPPSPRRP